MIPRIRHFLQYWVDSLSQHPGAYLISLYTACIWILFLYDNNGDNQLLEILTTCGIVFPLMITGSLLIQIQGGHTIQKRISQIIALMIGFLFYLYIHSLDIFNNTTSVDNDGIFIVLSYIVAWSSLLGGILYTTYKKTLLTRSWIKELLLNILIAIVSSLILRGGLSASIGSINYLFNIDIYYKRYQYIGVVAFCIIGVSILLTNLSSIKKIDYYPNIFRFFGLYIFLPLAIIYAVILITYGTKIIITQTWPKGLISWMVMGYTIRCTIVYFLTYPLQNQSWIKKIHTGYFVSILVFLPLLVGAIYQRITQYGITEERYLIVMIAIWITVVSIGSLIWRSKSWLFMIGGLLILTMSSTYTPRSASSVSLMNQKSRLKQLLIQHNLFDEKNITKKIISTASLTGQDYTDMNQIGMIGSYISQSHGTDELAYLYNGTTGFDNIKNNDRRNIYQPFLESLGYTGSFDQRNNGKNNIADEVFFNIYHNQDKNMGYIDVQDYSSLFYINSNQEAFQTIGSYNISITGKEKEHIIINRQEKEIMNLNLYNHTDELYQGSLQPDNNPSISLDKGLVIVTNLNGTIYKKDNTTSIGYYSLMIFVK